VTKTFSFLIHPSVDVTPNPLRVADIACGTGIWLKEMAKLFSHAQCDGFDISGALFPSATELSADNLGDRMQFHMGNIADTEGVSSEFEGVFDIVNIRFIHVNLLGKQWDQAVKNLVSMLKPGGYVQWADWDVRTFRICQNEPLAPKKGIEELVSGAQKFLATRDTGATTRLPQMLADNGIVDLTSELYPSDLDEECRTFLTRTFLGAAPEMIRNVVIPMEGSGWDEERLERVWKHAQSDIQAGKAFTRWETYCHVGRKQ
jgi:ubiquinone/menaquinone biosynthesis C-methylase UbiE